MIHTICPNCGYNGDFTKDPDTGEVICTNCGLIVEQEVCTQKPEQYDAVSQAGISALLTISDLKKKSTFQIQYSLRSMHLADELISQWSFGLALPPDIKTRAMQIYKLTLEANKTRGRKIEEIAAACMFLATKEISPRPLLALEETTLINRNVIVKQSKMITRFTKINSTLVDPKLFVPFLCTQIGRKYDVEAKAVEILRKTKISDQNPRIVAAAACYVAAMLLGQAVTIAECAHKTHTAEGTLVKHIENIKKELV
jgi:transcription initiation factor TFIIIB Brf1 subunit/transcription initiation factor TFIIB